MTSFRMVDGRVRGLDLHLERLRIYSSLESVPWTTEVERAILGRLRSFGRAPCNPKISLEGTQWVVTHRPDRVVEDSAIVRVHPVLDERYNPTVKGPDIYMLGVLMHRAHEKGATEGILGCPEAPRDRIVECFYSTPLAFDADGVVHVSTHPRALASVTAGLVLPLVERWGFRVIRHELGLRPPHLMRSHVWLLNSFSGVRSVSHWLEYAAMVPTSCPEIPEHVARAAGIDDVAGPAAWEHLRGVVNDYLWAQAQSVHDV